MADIESGTHPVSRGLVADVEGVCNEVDLALAEASVCIKFLGELATGVAHVAVRDAQAALDRINNAIERLRRSCEQDEGSFGGKLALPSGG